MSEHTETDVEIKKGKWYFSVAVGWTGYIISLLIILIILGTNLWLMFTQSPVPEQLSNWGTVCIGFLAMLISQARDIIKNEEK